MAATSGSFGPDIPAFVSGTLNSSTLNVPDSHRSLSKWLRRCVSLSFLIDERNRVRAQLCIPRDRPVCFRNLMLHIPRERKLVGLFAAYMLDHDRSGQLLFTEQGKTGRNGFSDEVLHVHCVPSPQERAVKDRVGCDRSAVPSFTKVEPIRLDPFIPCRMDEGHVVVGADEDKESP